MQKIEQTFVLELYSITRYILECNFSQNSVVFRWRFILEMKSKIYSDNVKSFLLPSDFPFQILFVLCYVIMAHMKTGQRNGSQVQNILDQLLLVHF